MPEGVIVPKKEFTHFVEREEGVTLHFKDGSEEHADVLVAADGVRFKVRYQLYPDCPQPREFGIAVWLGWCEAKDIDFDDMCIIQYDQNYQMGFCHPTSPYAAYGAGMAIEDGYFLGKFLKDADFYRKESLVEALQKYQKYDDLRRPYTNFTTKFARNMGRIYYNVPKPLRKIRGFLLDRGFAGKKIEQGVTEDATALLKLVLSEEF